jgi:hypothetical protein
MEKSIIDPEWTIENDRQSVTVGINTRLWILRQEGKIPTLIRLGKEHSLLFWKQRGVDYIPNKPTKLISGDVFWDEEQHCWCYSKRMIPIRFNDPHIIGIAAEGIPKPEKIKKKST